MPDALILEELFATEQSLAYPATLGLITGNLSFPRRLMLSPYRGRSIYAFGPLGSPAIVTSQLIPHLLSAD